MTSSLPCPSFLHTCESDVPHSWTQACQGRAFLVWSPQDGTRDGGCVWLTLPSSTHHHAQAETGLAATSQQRSWQQNEGRKTHKHTWVHAWGTRKMTNRLTGVTVTQWFLLLTLLLFSSNPFALFSQNKHKWKRSNSFYRLWPLCAASTPPKAGLIWVYFHSYMHII